MEVQQFPKPEPRTKERKQLERKTRLRKMSKKRQDETPERRLIKLAVFERDGWQCVFRGLPGAPPCLGDPTPHHVVRAGQCGSYSVENLVTACEGHNGWAETAEGNRLARAAGLVRSSWE